MKNELSDENAFYVIRPTICGQPADFIKLGRSNNIKRRFEGYARVYDDKFDILHLRIFRKSRLETAFEQGLGKRITDFAATFESQVKAALKKVLRPFRSDSDEIYKGDDYNTLKDTISKITNENQKVKIIKTKNRVSERLRKILR